MSSQSPTTTWTMAGIYIMSGVSQPIIMTICKNAGLADPVAQLYMLFYYLGPSLLVVPLLCDNSWPNKRAIVKACFIAAFDLTAQALNYTGASLAGATIFAVIYSSVTVWTAVFSRMFLNRSLTVWQWLSVLVVFGGLAITATGSSQLGPDVAQGTIQVLVGSFMHGGFYVMSEAVMTGEGALSVTQNAAIQAMVACASLTAWQIVYTLPRLDEVIVEPMMQAHTTAMQAAWIFFSFGLASLVHSFTFYHTVKHFTGGATSAGVMKGLQAVLVFVVAHFAFCHHGMTEMCFSSGKFISLITVVGGVVLFGFTTELARRREEKGYSQIECREVHEPV